MVCSAPPDDKVSFIETKNLSLTLRPGWCYINLSSNIFSEKNIPRAEDSLSVSSISAFAGGLICFVTARDLQSD